MLAVDKQETLNTLHHKINGTQAAKKILIHCIDEVFHPVYTTTSSTPPDPLLANCNSLVANMLNVNIFNGSQTMTNTATDYLKSQGIQ
jgi:hypothetical protein